jgi:Ribbon-helix-helix protein, copG family
MPNDLETQATCQRLAEMTGEPFPRVQLHFKRLGYDPAVTLEYLQLESPLERMRWTRRRVRSGKSLEQLRIEQAQRRAADQQRRAEREQRRASRELQMLHPSHRMVSVRMPVELIDRLSLMAEGRQVSRQFLFEQAVRQLVEQQIQTAGSR